MPYFSAYVYLFAEIYVYICTCIFEGETILPL